MEKVLSFRAYPWGELDHVARVDVTALRRLQQVVFHAVDLNRVATSLAELLGVHGEIVDTRLSIERGVSDVTAGIALGFEVRPGRTRITLELERDLVLTLVSGVLGRAVAIADPNAPCDASLAGAVAAILARTVRRSCKGSVLSPLGPSPHPVSGEARPTVRVALRLGAEVFQVRAIVESSARDVVSSQPTQDAFRRLGAIGLSLAVVAATSVASAAEVGTLTIGDTWLPQGGWSTALLPRRGHVVLVAPTSDRGIRGTLTTSREVVLGSGVRAHLDQEQEPAMPETSSTRLQADHAADASVEASPTTPDHDVSEAVLDVPVVVRVEVSAVTLTAREWAALRPGDIVPLDRPVSSCASLRVSGREVARGELVDIEGELGVRIRELVG